MLSFTDLLEKQKAMHASEKEAIKLAAEVRWGTASCLWRRWVYVRPVLGLQLIVLNVYLNIRFWCVLQWVLVTKGVSERRVFLFGKTSTHGSCEC